MIPILVHDVNKYYTLCIVYISIIESIILTMIKANNTYISFKSFIYLWLGYGYLFFFFFSIFVHIKLFIIFFYFYIDL